MAALTRQEFRPDHVYGKLEERICPHALADCLAYRDNAIAELNHERGKLERHLEY